ncbi:uncharacterized protein [Dermacentor andersoni]|uniref:uncharacterized protein n=1 Tax=Dermacentor andersoni TaxID=34620 RepID=UPI0024177F44|nr:uncharacterized protein LOC129383924 [Dermacentor andersoni]
MQPMIIALFVQAAGLLLGRTGVVLLVASVLLALFVPLIELAVLYVRYRRPPVNEQPETEEHAASRIKWSLCFWVLLAFLTFMVLGALLTKAHASMTLDSAQKQGRYLAHNIPDVSHRFTNAAGLLQGCTGVALLVASVHLALLVPLVGLAVLYVRYRRPSLNEQPETEEQAASRIKWSLCFWVLLAFLAFMVLGALLTKAHASVALDSAQKQGRYLVHTIPDVFHRPMNVSVL